MKAVYKTAAILIDEHDLAAFRGVYRDALTDKFCWFCLGYLPMLQVILQDVKEKYYFPQVNAQEECSELTKRIYRQSQGFLRQLCLDNHITEQGEDSFPLEFFWLCRWIAVHMIIAFCDDLLNQCPVEEVVLIERNNLVNNGGLLIEAQAFTGLVKDFCQGRGIKVSFLSDKGHCLRPKTIFYSQRDDCRSQLLHGLRFIRWKALSFNRKNHNYILVHPSYDNRVDYLNRSTYGNSFPQVFHGQQLPFLHSWRKLWRFLLLAPRYKKRFSAPQPIIEPYRCKSFDFEFDFAERFRSTIVQYLNDVRWMHGYIDLFWHTCLDNQRRYLTIFSLSPVHLHCYFLIKKTKEAKGKVAVWQHGGLYDYADHFIYYVQDYKHADYILSFGRDNLQDVTRFAGDSRASCIAVGSKMIYARAPRGGWASKDLLNAAGLFIPAILSSYYSESRINWQPHTYFVSTRQIIDYFASSRRGKLVIKGFKGYKPHLELRRYVQGYDLISYTDLPTNKALSGNPRFVILDSPSTALLEVLAQYNGPVFLLNNQPSYAIRDGALSLLRRRVIYSENIDELKAQLDDFCQSESLRGVDIKDTSFIDVYARRFSYHKYADFLQRVTQG